MARAEMRHGARCWACTVEALHAMGALAGDPLAREEGGEMATLDRTETRDGREYRVYRYPAAAATRRGEARRRTMSAARRRAARAPYRETVGATSSTEREAEWGMAA